ncbi:hypothetical protein BGZ61DRAFT_473577 [Ilyonectria robusta]|uniref:uncharacterized protein n=1 Tax=Ilyonectria robusta TaxID=1079257 RepID=UPI001E8D0974|nr:uncharacterized protein BGZ61DRAFT_473577 [Ilyonectria robusta]KAH8734910.1 hypothetical protein BGZ61DRAFT_473577 [Ilyonectria robusta]
MKAAALRKVQAENDEWDATAEERFYRGSPLLKNRRKRRPVSILGVTDEDEEDTEAEGDEGNKGDKGIKKAKEAKEDDEDDGDEEAEDEDATSEILSGDRNESVHDSDIDSYINGSDAQSFGSVDFIPEEDLSSQGEEGNNGYDSDRDSDYSIDHDSDQSIGHDSDHSIEMDIRGELADLGRGMTHDEIEWKWSELLGAEKLGS